MASPYERSINLAGLQPQLRSYFSEIPAGKVGRGVGVFDVVGTPRRWLWPILSLLAREGVVFPVWQSNVPFEIANSASLGGRASVRKFLFARRENSMVDFMTVENDALVDYLGTHKRYRATFAGSVSDGSLSLTSTSVATRILGAWVRLPLHVDLTEQWTGENQRVAVTLAAPVVGRIYEYTGSFSYEVCDD